MIFAIPEFGHRDLTNRCIESIICENPTARIFVGDDGYRQYQRKLIDGATLLSYKDNLGYTGNINRIVSYALSSFQADMPTGEDVLFVCNSDIAFLSGAAEILASYVLNNSVIAGPSVIIPSRHRPWHKQMVHSRFDIRHPKPFEMSMLSGCCLCMRAEIWLKVGGMDNRFWGYYSDDVFAIEAKKLGYSSVCVPAAFITHGVGSTVQGVMGVHRKIKKDKLMFESLYPEIKWSDTGVYSE
jgi:GT2 family glycosyltransferase